MPKVDAALRAAAADGSWGRYDGPHGERLAAALAGWLGLEHVLLCSSGTVAVELALRGAGVAAGDEVLLAGYDFPGNFRAIEAIGAKPVLIDLAAQRWTPSRESLDGAWSESTKALIVSHMHGNLACVDQLVAAAREHGACVVEDACQSPGGFVAGRLTGSAGDASVLSFGGSKLLTAGRGGAVLFRSAAHLQRAKIFNDRGNQAFPLSELQAAVLLPQLEPLAEGNARRQRAAARLFAALTDVPHLRPAARSEQEERPGYYKLSWFYSAEAAGESGRPLERAAFVAAARAEGIALDVGFRGFVGRSGNRCRRVGELPHARRAAEETVLLHHPSLLLDDASLDRIAETLAALPRWLARSSSS